MDTAQNQPDVDRSREGGNGNSEKIRTSIERTRSQMDRTLDEIGARLHPRHLLDDFLDYLRNRRASGKHDGERIKESAGQVGRAVVQEVRENPVPSLLIGAGIAWYLFQRDEEDAVMEEEMYEAPPGEIVVEGEAMEEVTFEPPGSGPLPEHYQDKPPDIGEKAAGMKAKASAGADKLKQSSQHAAERMRSAARRGRTRLSEQRARAKGRASSARRRAQGQLQDVYQEGEAWVRRTMDESPLATGLGFLALGLLAGLTLPSSRREDEWLGEKSEAVKDKAKAMGEDLVDRGKHVADAVKETAREEIHTQGLDPQSLKDKAMHVGAEAQKSVQETAKEEGLTPDAMRDKGKTIVEEAKEAGKQEAQHQKDELKR